VDGLITRVPGRPAGVGLWPGCYFTVAEPAVLPEGTGMKLVVPGKLFAHPNHRYLKDGGGSGLLEAEMRQSNAQEQGHVSLSDAIWRRSCQVLSCVSRKGQGAGYHELQVAAFGEVGGNRMVRSVPSLVEDQEPATYLARSFGQCLAERLW
jgi:hypothetical protein